MNHTLTFRLTVAVTVPITLPDDPAAARREWEQRSYEHQQALHHSLTLDSNVEGELTVTEVEQTDSLA